MNKGFAQLKTYDDIPMSLRSASGGEAISFNNPLFSSFRKGGYGGFDGSALSLCHGSAPCHSGYSNANNSLTGFTLIELMVVILIIGIIGIIAAPNMRSWYTGFQVRSCADGITNTLVTARMNAIRNGNNVVVAFYTGACPAEVAGINTNTTGSCYITINDANNDCVALGDVPGCFENGEFNGVVNTCSSSIVFPNAIIQKSGAAFTVPTTYCTVTGNNVQPCVIPDSCTFCNGGVGAVAFQPDGSALLLGTAGTCNGSVCGGSVTIIPSSDAANNDGSREYAIGIISLTGAVKEFY